MANQESNATQKGTKKFNPTITALFENSKFGEGALLSANIDAKGYEVIQRHLEIGSKLVVRKSPRLSKNGNTTYFLEVLPPLTENNNRKTSKRNTAEDEI